MYSISLDTVNAEIEFANNLNLNKGAAQCEAIDIRDFKNGQRGGLENVRTESGAGASTAF